MSRFRVARAALLAAAVGLAVALVAPVGPAQAAGVTKVSTFQKVKCSVFTYTPQVDWYMPSTTPKGLVWLQHGFSRTNGNMGDLAKKYAEAGYVAMATTYPSADIFGCTIQNLGNNDPFLNNVTKLLGEGNNTGGELHRNFNEARSAAGVSYSLPQRYILVGHSAGGEMMSYVANRLRTNHAGQFAKVKGLVLLDPVKSMINENMTGALTGLKDTGLPIATISSPPYTANSDASGTTVLRSVIQRPWVGVQLTTGCHCDAEGATTDVLCTLTSGTPQAQNIAALQTLAVNWGNDWATGVTNPTYYPGGAYYNGLLNAGTISSLAGAA